MNLGALIRAFDAAVTLGEIARRVKRPPPGAAPPEETGGEPNLSVSSRSAGHIETRLTGVLVAALKEAFKRDHARLELEKAHIEESRRRDMARLELERAQMEEAQRRAEEALRLEVRRQAIERELARLRWLAGTALVGWVSSIAMFVVRADVASQPSRFVLAAGWLLLLGALGAAFTAQARLGAAGEPESAGGTAVGAASALPLWLLTAGLAVVGVGMLL